MHLVPVIASITKISMALLWVQRKVDMGLESLRRGRRVGGYLGEISPSLGVPLFRLIFQRFKKITYDLY
jgi:hypothetical protein